MRRIGAARRAVAREARRAGGGAGHPGARAAIAGPRHAPRARLIHVAGEVDVGGQRNVRRRRAAGEVERAALRALQLRVAAEPIISASEPTKRAASPALLAHLAAVRARGHRARWHGVDSATRSSFIAWVV